VLICIDTLASRLGRRITAVIPYYGYARQDRKTGPRTPITAQLGANLIAMAGADRVLTLRSSTQDRFRVFSIFRSTTFT